MSRYTLKGAVRFGEIVVGWDRPAEAFFFQGFKECETDETGPIEWHSRLSLEDLVLWCAAHGAPLPDLARRALLAEQHDGPMDFVLGDPVIARLDNGECKFGKVTKLLEGHCVRVRYANKIQRHKASDLLPDLKRVGVL